MLYSVKSKVMVSHIHTEELAAVRRWSTVAASSILSLPNIKVLSKRLSQVDLVEPKAATLHANWISRQQPL